jgi:hypothetical protein
MNITQAELLAAAVRAGLTNEQADPVCQGLPYHLNLVPANAALYLGALFAIGAVGLLMKRVWAAPA